MSFLKVQRDVNVKRVKKGLQEADALMRLSRNSPGEKPACFWTKREGRKFEDGPAKKDHRSGSDDRLRHSCGKPGHLSWARPLSGGGKVVRAKADQGSKPASGLSRKVDWNPKRPTRPTSPLRGLRCGHREPTEGEASLLPDQAAARRPFLDF